MLVTQIKIRNSVYICFFLFSSLLNRCHNTSNLRPNIVAITFTTAASRPISLTLIPNNSFSVANNFKVSGKHSASSFLEYGIPSIKNGMMFYSLPKSIKL